MKNKERLQEYTYSLASLLLNEKISDPHVIAIRDNLTEESKQNPKDMAQTKI